MAIATPAIRWWGGVGWRGGGGGGVWEGRRGGRGWVRGEGGEDLHGNGRRCRASSLHALYNCVRECRLSDARRRRVLGCAYGELGVIDVAHTWLWRLNPRHWNVLDADAFADSVRFRLGCAGITKTRLSKLHATLDSWALRPFTPPVVVWAWPPVATRADFQHVRRVRRVVVRCSPKRGGKEAATQDR